MGSFIGVIIFFVLGAFSAFYCLKRAKGAVWAHFLGWFIAFGFGLAIMGTFISDTLQWAAGWIGAGAASVLVLFTLVTLFDFRDKKPDAMAYIGALIIPSMIGICLTQVWVATADARNNFNEIKATVQQKSK